MLACIDISEEAKRTTEEARALLFVYDITSISLLKQQFVVTLRYTADRRNLTDS
jgi:hypothetical protein